MSPINNEAVGCKKIDKADHIFGILRFSLLLGCSALRIEGKSTNNIKGNKAESINIRWYLWLKRREKWWSWKYECFYSKLNPLRKDLSQWFDEIIALWGEF